MKLISKLKSRLLNLNRKLFLKREEVYCYINKNDWKYNYNIPDNIIIELGNGDSILKLKDLQPNLFSEKKTNKFKKRLNSGHLIMLIKYNNEIAGYSWLAFDNFMLGVGVEVPLNKNEGAFYDARTFEEFRGHGAYKSAIYEGINILFEHGCEIVYSNYDPNNYITRHTFENMNFEVFSTYKLLRIFGFERLTINKPSF